MSSSPPSAASLSDRFHSAWKADQASVSSVIQQSLDDLSHQIDLQSQQASVEQDSLRRDFLLLAAFHDKLRESLESMQEQGQHILSGIARGVQAIRQELAAGSRAVVALSFSMEDSFSHVYGNLSDIGRVQREQTELLAQLAANPLGLFFNRLLSSFGYIPAKVTLSRALKGAAALVAHSQAGDVTTGPVIVAALLLAGRSPAHKEKAAWAGVSFALFLVRLASRLYKFPVVVHVIFVKGFCDDKYEVLAIEARSAQVRLHPTP